MTHLAHELIGASVSSGDTVVDATAGNGYDTLFLARLVGKEGRVHAFDVQQAALDSTTARLQKYGCSAVLHLCSHADMSEHVEEARAVMFNLGYLPGADHEKITQKKSTLAAVEAGLSILLPGGVMTCICYPGHPGGLDEAEAVLSFAQQKAEASFELITANEKDRLEGRPFLVAFKKQIS